jgi:hypothetical protein
MPHHHDVLALALHLNDDRLQPLNHIQVRLARRVPARYNMHNRKQQVVTNLSYADLYSAACSSYMHL